MPYTGEKSMICSFNYKQLTILQYKARNGEWQEVKLGVEEYEVIP